MVFIFHGLSGNIYEVLYNADFNRIAAEQGWITITPQALPDTFSAMDTTITMNAWHSGVSAVVEGDTIVATDDLQKLTRTDTYDDTYPKEARLKI